VSSSWRRRLGEEDGGVEDVGVEGAEDRVGLVTVMD